jgi:hypothetical protein
MAYDSLRALLSIAATEDLTVWLRYNHSAILSSCGMQQGDALVPFLCLSLALALDALVLDIQRHHPELLMAWYLDDGIFTGPPVDLAAILRLTEERGPALGRQLNMGKREGWSKDLDLDMSSVPARVTQGMGLSSLAPACASLCAQNRWPARKWPRSRPSLSALTAWTGVRGTHPARPWVSASPSSRFGSVPAIPS